MRSSSTQSGWRHGMSRRASALDWLTVTKWPAFSSSARAMSAWVRLSSTMYTVRRRSLAMLPPRPDCRTSPAPGQAAPGGPGRPLPALVAPRAVEDDGAMSALLAPGIALMSRLRYPRKFALISLCFSLPLGLLVGLWLGQITSRLDVARSERLGLEYV